MTTISSGAVTLAHGSFSVSLSEDRKDQPVRGLRYVILPSNNRIPGGGLQLRLYMQVVGHNYGFWPTFKLMHPGSLGSLKPH